MKVNSPGTSGPVRLKNKDNHSHNACLKEYTFQQHTGIEPLGNVSVKDSVY